MRQRIGKALIKLYKVVNSGLQKRKQVLICEPWNIESNCVEVANCVASKYSYPVYYAVPKNMMVHARKLVFSNVKVIEVDSLLFKYIFLTSKYIFVAHWKFQKYYSKDQSVVNLWHGIAYKKIALLRGKPGMFADFTVATSKLTQKAFTDCFGNPLDTALITGYPRNDIMLRAQKDQTALKMRMDGNLERYDKIIIWLPTFRTDTVASHGTDGVAANNVFQIQGFDVAPFNALLRKHNTLCIVKPHPLDVQWSDDYGQSNVMVINDEWLWKQGLTLYHLTACTDILVSDISSVMIDYMLLDKPVICFSTDFDEYEHSRGFYFEDIENWLPSKLIRDQGEFMSYLENLLIKCEDPSEEKRKELKQAFFEFQDASSTERLLSRIF
jgi:CDP-glycerol glycerophosphotransferase (TagB/SpsB family)